MCYSVTIFLHFLTFNQKFESISYLFIKLHSTTNTSEVDLDSPLSKEGVQHVLSELQGEDVPGLYLVDTGDVLLLLAPENGVAEQVAIRTSVQQGLKY